MNYWPVRFGALGAFRPSVFYYTCRSYIYKGRNYIYRYVCISHSWVFCFLKSEKCPWLFFRGERRDFSRFCKFICFENICMQKETMSVIVCRDGDFCIIYCNRTHILQAKFFEQKFIHLESAKYLSRWKEYSAKKKMCIFCKQKIWKKKIMTCAIARNAKRWLVSLWRWRKQEDSLSEKTRDVLGNLSKVWMWIET